MKKIQSLFVVFVTLLACTSFLMLQNQLAYRPTYLANQIEPGTEETPIHPGPGVCKDRCQRPG